MMGGLMLAAACAASACVTYAPAPGRSVITAPPGFYARAWWSDAEHKSVNALLENRTAARREGVTVRCKLYEGADPVVKGAVFAYPGTMEAYEAEQVWAPTTLQPGVHPTRFVCKITEGFQ